MRSEWKDVESIIRELLPTLHNHSHKNFKAYARLHNNFQMKVTEHMRKVKTAINFYILNKYQSQMIANLH